MPAAHSGFAGAGHNGAVVSHDWAGFARSARRAILLNGGRVVTDGAPLDVLNRYQGIIMEREQAYEAGAESRTGESAAPSRDSAPLSYTYRHGNQGAEILAADLTVPARRLKILEPATR